MVKINDLVKTDAAETHQEGKDVQIDRQRPPELTDGERPHLLNIWVINRQFGGFQAGEEVER